MKQLDMRELERFEKVRGALGILDEEEALALAIAEGVDDVDHNTLRRIVLVMFEDIEVSE